MDELDLKDWEQFRANPTSHISHLEYKLVAELHAKYFKHSFYLPCKCSPKQSINGLHKSTIYMRGIRSTNKFEKAFIWFYNAFDDWQLKWVGDQNLPYDAIGKTPKRG